MSQRSLVGPDLSKRGCDSLGWARSLSEDCLSLPTPVLVLPGYRGSTLLDRGEQVYPAGDRGLRPALLTPGAPSRPLEAGVEITPGAPLPVVFDGFLRALGRHLGEGASVAGWAVDWRQAIDTQVDALDAFLDDHIARLRATAPYAGSAWAERPQVDLVGQALGATLALRLLARRGGDPRVGKVVSICGAFRGNPSLALRTAGAAGREASDEARAMADLMRLSPSTWSLLPDDPERVVADPGLPQTLLVRAAWSEEVLDAIARRTGLRGGEAHDAAEAHLSMVLREARRFTASAAQLRSLDDLGLTEERLLVIAGVGYPTLQRVRLRGRPGAPRIEHDDADVLDAWSPRGGPGATATGDGVVPFSTAVPAFLPVRRMVCLAPRDLAPFELKDRLIQCFTNLHVAMPGLDRCQRIVARFLGAEVRGEVAGRVPPGVETADWEPPVPGLLPRNPR